MGRLTPYSLCFCPIQMQALCPSRVEISDLAETNFPDQCFSKAEPLRPALSGRSTPMTCRLCLVTLAVLFATGCNNTLNPFCGSARPAPLIGSLSPSTVSFSDVQQGIVLTVNGSQFLPSSEVLINGKA